MLVAGLTANRIIGVLEVLMLMALPAESEAWMPRIAESPTWMFIGAVRGL